MERVYIGLPKAGLDEARRDVERHAAKVAAEIAGNDEVVAEAVLEAFTCDDTWPTR